MRLPRRCAPSRELLKRLTFALNDDAEGAHLDALALAGRHARRLVLAGLDGEALENALIAIGNGEDVTVASESAAPLLESFQWCPHRRLVEACEAGKADLREWLDWYIGSTVAQFESGQFEMLDVWPIGGRPTRALRKRLDALAARWEKEDAAASDEQAPAPPSNRRAA